MKKRIKSLWFEVKYEILDILKNAPLFSQRLFTCCNASIAESITNYADYTDIQYYMKNNSIDINERVWFLRVQLFMKGCVLVLALPLIMVMTSFHTRVSRKGLCIPLRENFPLSGNSANILFIYL